LFSIYIEPISLALLADWRAERRLLLDEAGQVRPSRERQRSDAAYRPPRGKRRSERKSAGIAGIFSSRYMHRKMTLVKFHPFLLFWEMGIFFHQRHLLFNYLREMTFS